MHQSKLGDRVELTIILVDPDSKVKNHSKVKSMVSNYHANSVIKTEYCTVQSLSQTLKCIAPSPIELSKCKYFFNLRCSHCFSHTNNL